MQPIDQKTDLLHRLLNIDCVLPTKKKQKNLYQTFKLHHPIDFSSILFAVTVC